MAWFTFAVLESVTQHQKRRTLKLSPGYADNYFSNALKSAWGEWKLTPFFHRFLLLFLPSFPFFIVGLAGYLLLRAVCLHVSCNVVCNIAIICAVYS